MQIDWRWTNKAHPLPALPDEVDGFSLSAVYVHYPPLSPHTSHTIVKHRVPERRRLSPLDDDSDWASNRSKVLTLAKLNALGYPLYYYPDNGFIFENEDGIYDCCNQTKDKLGVEHQISEWHRLFEATDATLTSECDPAPTNSESCSDRGEGQLLDQIGVAMMVYKRGSYTIIAFRGTYTHYDGDNILNWLKYWFIEKMGGQVQRQWEEAGNSISSVISDRALHLAGATNAAFRVGGNGDISDFLSKLQETYASAAAVPADTAEEIKRTGYWAVIKVQCTISTYTIHCTNVLGGDEGYGARAAPP
jgi:hypothetical protein